MGKPGYHKRVTLLLRPIENQTAISRLCRVTHGFLLSTVRRWQILSSTIPSASRLQSRRFDSTDSPLLYLPLHANSPTRNRRSLGLQTSPNPSVPYLTHKRKGREKEINFKCISTREGGRDNQQICSWRREVTSSAAGTIPVSLSSIPVDLGFCTICHRRSGFARLSTTKSTVFRQLIVLSRPGSAIGTM